MTILTLRIDAKGRLGLPKPARDALGLGVNVDVTVTVEDGRVVIESTESVQGRVWSKALATHTARTSADGDARHEAATLVSRERKGSQPSDEVGQALLEELGLSR